MLPGNCKEKNKKVSTAFAKAEAEYPNGI